MPETLTIQANILCEDALTEIIFSPLANSRAHKRGQMHKGRHPMPFIGDVCIHTERLPKGPLPVKAYKKKRPDKVVTIMMGNRQTWDRGLPSIRKSCLMLEHKTPVAEPHRIVGCCISSVGVLGPQFGTSRGRG